MSGVPKGPRMPTLDPLPMLVAVWSDIRNNVLDRILTYTEWNKHKEEYDAHHCKLMTGFDDELDAYLYIQKHGGLGPSVIEKPKEQTDERNEQ